MTQLTYTHQMAIEDENWDTENENPKVMNQLQKELIEEAMKVSESNKDLYDISSLHIVYEVKENMAIVNITSNKEVYERYENGDYGYYPRSSSNCKKLKEILENILNGKTY